MSTMSYVFMGMMVLPLVLFLMWIIKQNKKKTYLAMIILAIGIIAASFVIIKYDSNFRLPSDIHKNEAK